MEEERGLWDLLFGVSDPDIDCSQVKMEENAAFQMDLSEDLLALLGEPMKILTLVMTVALPLPPWILWI